MQYHIFLFLFQTIIFLNQFNSPHAKAIRGYNVAPTRNDEFLSVVSIMKFELGREVRDSDLICTATLISLDHAVTAEHCILPNNRQMVVLLVGSSDIKEARQTFTMWWLSFNHWYSRLEQVNPYDNNDIAVVKLIRSAPAHIAPPFYSQVPIPDSATWEVRIAGWGIANNGAYPRFLNTAPVIIISNSQCYEIASRILGLSIYIPETWFCTQSHPYIHLDKGDDGGPIFDRNGTLIGINIENCPTLNGRFNAEKSILHLDIGYYAEFLDFTLNE